MALSKTTRDHDEIRQWAESRGAVPSEVAATQTGDEPGILRFQFPKAPRKNDGALQEISWDDFFEKFDENNLSLIYQDKTASGRKSNFNKLIHADGEKSTSSRSGKKTAATSSAKHSARSSRKTA